VSEPLIYGYMRVASDQLDGDVRQMELALQFVAEQEGLRLASIFREVGLEPLSGQLADRGQVRGDGCGCPYAAWRALIAELRRAAAHQVIVPSLTHISRHDALREGLILRLQRDANAEVLSLEDYTPTQAGHSAVLSAVPATRPGPRA
jgi:hypothetical protein